MTDVTADGQCVRVQTPGLAGLRTELHRVVDDLSGARSGVSRGCSEARHGCGDHRLAAQVDEFGQLARSAVESLSSSADAMGSALQRAAIVYELVDIP